jgi:hypothetical protein
VRRRLCGLGFRCQGSLFTRTSFCVAAAFCISDIVRPQVRSARACLSLGELTAPPVLDSVLRLNTNAAGFLFGSSRLVSGSSSLGSRHGTAVDALPQTVFSAAGTGFRGVSRSARPGRFPTHLFFSCPDDVTRALALLRSDRFLAQRSCCVSSSRLSSRLFECLLLRCAAALVIWLSRCDVAVREVGVRTVP